MRVWRETLGGNDKWVPDVSNNRDLTNILVFTTSCIWRYNVTVSVCDVISDTKKYTLDDDGELYIRWAIIGMCDLMIFPEMPDMTNSTFSIILWKHNDI